MCGVLYFKGDGSKHKELIVNLLQQSRIRGLHAFGVSLRSTPKESFQTIRTFSLPEAEQYILDNQFCELIGHCRYDTSGDWRVLENNQPIAIGHSILAFNGVVRMSTREEYQQEFGREYTTENDGEIVLRMIAEKDGRLLSLLEQNRVTFAGVAYVNGKAMALRNERRPLWRGLMLDTEFVISTVDIFKRSIRALRNPNEYATMLYQEIPEMEPVWL